VSTDNSEAAEVAISRIDAESEEDQSVDVRALLVIISMLVLGAVHFISGWTF
jgi:hypothetical protein